MARPTHFEISADDPERALRFYDAVFGWKGEKWDGPADYWMLRTGEGPGIDGAIAPRQDGVPPLVNVVEVEAIDDAVARVAAAGGEVVRPKAPVPGVGWAAYANDTEGNLFGIFQPDPQAG